MDGFDAVLRQLAEHGERLALLDAREAEHFAAVGQRLTELGTLVTGLGSAVRDQAAALAALQGLDVRKHRGSGVRGRRKENLRHVFFFAIRIR